MDKLVLYIEKEKFLRSMLEVIFKKKNAKIQTVESINDYFYLIEDLKPQIIFFDVETVGESLDQLLSFKEITFIACGKPEVENKITGRVSKFISKPIIASTIFDTLYSHLN